MGRTWRFRNKHTDHIDTQKIAKLKDLKATIKKLKCRGEPFLSNKWGTPIIPLLIEHVFMEIAKFSELDSITIDTNERRYI